MGSRSWFAGLHYCPRPLATLAPQRLSVVLGTGSATSYLRALADPRTPSTSFVGYRAENPHHTPDGGLVCPPNPPLLRTACSASGSLTSSPLPAAECAGALSRSVSLLAACTQSEIGSRRPGVSAPPGLLDPQQSLPSSPRGTEPPGNSSGNGWRVESAAGFVTSAAAYVVCSSMRPLTGAVVAPAPELCRRPRGPPPRGFRPVGTPAPLIGLPPCYAGRAVSAYGGLFCRLPRHHGDRAGWRP